jgi:hypothetical protein
VDFLNKKRFFSQRELPKPNVTLTFFITLFVGILWLGALPESISGQFAILSDPRRLYQNLIAGLLLSIGTWLT